MLDDTTEQIEGNGELSVHEDNSKDDILRSIQSEFEQHKKDHQNLHDKVINLIEGNQNLDKGRFMSSCNDDHMTNKLVESLKSKIKILCQEKETAEELWHTSQKTVASLEAEVAQYRRQLSHPGSIQTLRNEYLRRLKEMDNNIKQLQDELKKEVLLNTNLKTDKLEAVTKLSDLENKFKEILSQKKNIVERCMNAEAALVTAKSQITLLTKENSKLECALEKANRSVQEHITKETEAISKVQEALNLAESALIEKDTCLLREKESREECDYLARTIGQVMEEAAKKVDDDIDALKKEHQKQMVRLEEAFKKNQNLLSIQCKRTQSAESKCKGLQEQIKNLSKANVLLDSNLTKASQTIIDLEFKIDALQKGIKKEQEHSKLCEDKVKHLQELIESNKKTKMQWKQVTLDVSNRLHSKISELQTHIRTVEKENSKLHRQLLSSSHKFQMPDNSSSDSNGYDDNDLSPSKS